MKINAVLRLTVLLVGSCLQTVSAGDTLNEQQLRKCISYHETAMEKAGNIKRLEEVMDEAEDYIDSYDVKLERLEWEISTTIGSKRNNLIYQYKSMEADRNKLVDAYNFALEKFRVRERQYNSAVQRLQDECYRRSVKSSTLDKVCRGSDEGLCGSFN